MKRIVFLFAFLVACVHAYAFDWKPQSNEDLRRDMFSFIEKFRDGTSDRKLSVELGVFLTDQMNQATARPYAWIQDTHDFVDRMLERYPAEISDGGRCSFERRNLLLLRDYPMHADNKPKDAPQGLKDAYVNSVKGLYAAAEADALQWLSKGGRSKKLDIFKVYNMGFIFRSQGQTVGVDLQWSGDRKQMDELASHLDVLFLTHPHGDHYTKELLVAMLEAGKPVVMPCDLVPEYTGGNKIVQGDDNPHGKMAGKTAYKSMMGNQGARIPCNVYLLTVGSWNIVHNGDNSVEDIENYLSSERVDVFVGACWNGIKDTMDKIKANPSGTECVYFSAHENEWGHTVDHREAFEELFRRTDRLGDQEYDYLRTVVMDAAGDRFILK